MLFTKKVAVDPRSNNMVPKLYHRCKLIIRNWNKTVSQTNATCAVKGATPLAGIHSIGARPWCVALLWYPVMVPNCGCPQRPKSPFQGCCSASSCRNFVFQLLVPWSRPGIPQKNGKQAPLQSQTVHTPVELSQVCYKIRKHTPSSTSTFDEKCTADASTKSECMPLLNHHTSIKCPSIECTPPSPGPRQSWAIISTKSWGSRQHRFNSGGQ